jgi:hypothetical protein
MMTGLFVVGEQSRPTVSRCRYWILGLRVFGRSGGRSAGREGEFSRAGGGECRRSGARGGAL